MAVVPEQVLGGPYLTGSRLSVEEYLHSLGWNLSNRGKVRDSYVNPHHPDHMLVVATDRISIFDFVLPALVAGKGEVLTALTHFWLTKVFSDVPNHLVGVPDRLVRLPHERCLLVHRLKMEPWELIFRHHIGGSVWKEYQEKGTAGGNPLPPGLIRWQKLDAPIFTPSTKAESGHDENVTAAHYFEVMGEKGRQNVELLTGVYQRAYPFSEKRGLIILDTKFEMGDLLGDEVFTPDSSRYTTVKEYKAAMAAGRDPSSYDKELVRIWGRSVETPFGVTGIHQLDPENPDHLQFVHSLVVPKGLLNDTMQRYREIFRMLTGMKLHQYQSTVMNIRR